MDSVQQRMRNAGYVFVGPSKHAAIKVCAWTKKALTGKGECYKNAFYGIKSWRCLQLSTGLFCDNSCLHCWRETAFLGKEWSGSADSPAQILDEAIAAQRHLLNGFPGHEKIDRTRLQEAREPLHAAISLTGEPTLYPRLSELLRELRERKMTSFLVSNGLHPEIFRKLAEENALPTQLYVSLNAWDAVSFAKTSGNPSNRVWPLFGESLDEMNSLRGKTRTVLRMTLAKNLNLSHASEYAELIKKSGCDYCEVKAWMALGSSRERLGVGAMPSHAEIREFALELARETGYLPSVEHVPSRVVLLCRDEKAEKSRLLHF
ncbi:4-demethylwyosine synthase TYW1 [Candidatus Micrarchaeota archaeon]|nr:4-demethylwyosine synthase TYW1 [Candidatus Micrarchaeota archaeon]